MGEVSQVRHHYLEVAHRPDIVITHAFRHSDTAVRAIALFCATQPMLITITDSPPLPVMQLSRLSDF
ncbi:MAG: hypothetical protein AAF773_18425 [Cyanobacteria bacterium P01_D01_bin.115]